MNHDERTGRPQQRTFVYHGNIPPALALALMAPLLFLLLSMAAALLAGGTIAALFLPLALGRRWLRGKPRASDDAIELSREDYHRVDDEARRLPRE